MSKQGIKQYRVASGFDEQIYTSNQRLLFTKKPQRTTTGQLILEMALFAAENKRFEEGSDLTAGDKALIHLQRIEGLSKQRQAELAILLSDNT